MGDKLIGYISRISRWSAVLEVVDSPYRDDTPRFAQADDPYVNRFPVKPLAVLPFEKTLPVQEQHVWNALTFTRDEPKGSSQWTTPVRNSLNQLKDADGEFLEGLLLEQDSHDGVTYPVDPKLLPTVDPPPPIIETVVPPEDTKPEIEPPQPANEGRESIRVQARLAEIGSLMGLDVWIPRNDRGRVERHLPSEGMRLVDRLPLNYDDRTIKTIEQIDVLWLREHSIARAFEVEHTTAIYSGLVRMADLRALQPNVVIPLHIVAPLGRREKVFQEIRRPAFAHFDLVKRCSFISYESVQKLHQNPHLAHLTDTVLTEYEEHA